MKVVFLILIIILPNVCYATNDDLKQKRQKAFEWVFGEYARLSSEMREKVLAGKPGERHYVDRDGDGKPEEVWFVDISPRHKKENQPILVRVIDENGNLEAGGEPDQCGDLYVVDWHGDGTVDAVVGYEDSDGDQDVDRMGLYFYDDNYGLRVWWSRDDGDDNLLWYDVDYYYYQDICQDKTHFGGDESFISLYIKPGENRWTPFFENPFLFFDNNKDGVTEETLRVSGKKNVVQSVRWSFDVDGDATIHKPRDFDVSLSAYAPGWTIEKLNESDFRLHINENLSEILNIRGRQSFPVLKREVSRSYLKEVTWARVLMTWDENDLNKSFNPIRPDIERWEGVIAAPSNDKGFEFPVIGGPDCGPYNKRYELCLSPRGPNAYYFNPADRRIHLKYSDKTWLKVDYDYDNKCDMYYLWTDTDRDGVMDKLEVDIDGDGKMDDSFILDVSKVRPVQWTFEDLNTTYAPIVVNEPLLVYELNQALIQALESIHKGIDKEPVWEMIEHRMSGEHLTENLSQRLVNSDETMLYYLRLAADRRIVALKKAYKNRVFWKHFADARTHGNLKEMIQQLSKQFKITSTKEDYNSWLKNLRSEPSQKKVAWNNTWLPPNWGWESEKAAFRCYDGHFDLFGKRVDGLLYPTIDNASSYHLDDGGIGMDILHVGQTGGCGGLVLYVDGIPYPIRNEKREGDPVFSARLFEETSDKVTVEFTVTGVGPKEAPYTVYIRPSALAGRYDSPVEVEVKGGDPDRKIQLGLVLNVLPTEEFFLDKAAGVMGVWGFQEPVIGWIGTGVVFDPDKLLYADEQPEEHRVVLQYEKGEIFRYHIQGDWLRGHRFGPSAGMKDWLKTLQNISKSIKWR